MLTPRFQLSQDEAFLTVTIYAPFTHVADTEVFMDGKDFRFFSKPYFLRLHLPGEIEENDHASAKYDADERSFVVSAPKRVKGERFEGLDMLTELLRPKGETEVTRPGIEVVEEAMNEQAPGEEDEEEIDWYFDQQVVEKEQDVSDGVRLENAYGFGFKEAGVFERLQDEFQEVLDLKSPDGMTREQRREKRLELETQAFDDDHYLADFYEEVPVSMGPSPWKQLLEQDKEISFKKEEQERLISLPRRENIIEPVLLKSVHFGLIDILFAYSYEYRTGDWEIGTEAGWTMTKLAATLGCCEKFDKLKECVVSGLRRSLIYPLYRNFDLSVKVFQDVVLILKLGRPAIVKALLEAHAAMLESDGRYIFNQLYVEPYAVWVQSVNPVHLTSLAEALETTLAKVEKKHLRLDLEELEHASKLVLEESEEDKLTKSMDEVKLDSDDDSDDSDETSESESDETSSSSSSGEETDSSNSDAEKTVIKNN